MQLDAHVFERARHRSGPLINLAIGQATIPGINGNFVWVFASSFGDHILHAKVVCRRQFVVPPPYIVQVTCSRPKALFNGRLGICEAYAHGVGKCLDMVTHCVRQHVLGMPQWANFEVGIIEANFEMKHTLFNHC
jgi:hypothetical protein